MDVAPDVPITTMPTCFDAPFPAAEWRVDAACADSRELVAGEGIELTLLANVSHCGGGLPCEVSINEDDEVIDLTTFYCASADDCLIPPPLTGSCRLPPLPSGTWRVRINGVDGFDLPVRDRGAPPELPTGPTCWTFAPEIPPELGPDRMCTWPGDWLVATSACHRVELSANYETVISVVTDCACGNPSGACTASVADGVIRVHSELRDCGSRCRDTCAAPAMQECWFPPGLPLGLYEVIVDGIAESSTLVVREFRDVSDPTTRCIGL
jgi:hypothetical protein